MQLVGGWLDAPLASAPTCLRRPLKGASSCQKASQTQVTRNSKRSKTGDSLPLQQGDLAAARCPALTKGG